MKARYAPLIKAGIAIHAGDGLKALAALEPNELYEFVAMPVDFIEEGAYLRGQAKLLMKKDDAAAEFQKMIDHKALIANSVTGALAHLELGRAYAMQAAGASGADAEALRAKARTAYQDFLALWNKADADVPVHVQAKAEHSKLPQ